ncbi:MAG: glycoside hydrolase family 97 catalytic domain-containing protein, partial [Bacteroidota bacterium]
TTENTKRYIDFASENNIDAILVEGWNTGWEVWLNPKDREGAFDFVTPYEDYDLDEVIRYGKEKGVSLVMHHETSAVPLVYEKQLDAAFALCQEHDIHAIKTGYVGKIIPEGQYHHGQFMVNHYRKVLETAIKYQIMVNAHEPIKATGIRRTYPHMVAREGLRGQEFNAWSVDLNPPEHLAIVPFTRMLAGPIDFTPGIFDIKFDKYKEREHVSTTLAKQLSLYVVLYSPIQMAADLPENYEDQPAFQFIRDVALNWDQSKVLNAEIGDYVTIARKARDSEEWFLGSLTDENPRELEVALDFLEAGKDYVAEMYVDAEDAHEDTNPTAIDIKQYKINASQTLKLKLAPGGGAAIRFRPAGADDT